jgi:hypothetical protein
MKDILKKYDKIISLGFNCYIKRFMEEQGIKQETNLFDYIGTPMWGVNELIENDFTELTSIDYFEKMNISSKEPEHIFTNKKYYFRFKHDNLIAITGTNKVNINSFSKLKSTLERRIQRFNNTLSSPKKILFIRLEQDNTNRIVYEEYKEKDKIPELEYVISFSKIIKNKYPLINFDILFISKTNENKYDTENNILIIKNTQNIVWKTCQTQLQKICKHNIDFIKKSLI